MEITVKSLTSVNYENGSLELSKKDFDRIDSIIRQLAAERTGWYGLEFDEIYSTLWVKASEIIKDGGYDFAWLYYCLRNKVRDLARDASRKNTRGFTADDIIMDSALYSGESYDDYDEGTSDVKVPKVDPTFNFHYEIGSISQDCFDFSELLGLFEEGSSEWKWLYLTAIRNKLIDVAPETYDRLFTDEHSVDYEVSALLGYNSQSNSGYRNIRDRVRNKVAKHLALVR